MKQYWTCPTLELLLWTRLFLKISIKEMGATFDDVTWITFTAVAANGTMGELWKAAETCYQQAKLAVGDWHTFIEDFNMEDDGSFTLVTGS
jgi:hypothetical protein